MALTEVATSTETLISTKAVGMAVLALAACIVAFWLAWPAQRLKSHIWRGACGWTAALAALSVFVPLWHLSTLYPRIDNGIFFSAGVAMIIAIIIAISFIPQPKQPHRAPAAMNYPDADDEEE